MISKIIIITAVVLFIAAVHGANAVGLYDAPDALLDPTFAACLIISAGVIVLALSIPSQIIWFLLLLLFIWGVFAYVYGNYVLQII